jgi:hypothetical protein
LRQRSEPALGLDEYTRRIPRLADALRGRLGKYQDTDKNLVLGNYTILDKIGQGGMGQVFKAQHRRMDRIVAIKMLPDSVSKDGTTTRWSFGDSERDLGQYAWIVSNSDNRTHRVGELTANPFGLFDLYGIVWEWCWDWHGGYAHGLVSDPTGSEGPAKTDNPGRVLRGSSFSYGASYSRSATRVGPIPRTGYGSYGFRVCCGYRSQRLGSAARTAPR